jgi:hypothetical protein
MAVINAVLTSCSLGTDLVDYRWTDPHDHNKQWFVRSHYTTRTPRYRDLGHILISDVFQGLHLTSVFLCREHTK